MFGLGLRLGLTGLGLRLEPSGLGLCGLDYITDSSSYNYKGLNCAVD